ncbi:MAG: bifunctional glutamate N-acetyltransferase/amino-acid acetyltransferase ArgJ [Phycisphaerae bacterium]|nr:bifunctional glutamate N-acetyltransferase/amino-acid acetyltransferase ArgJ [Phycisphaerae bacterium]
MNNTITAPKGFLAAGLHCGIKKSGKFDLGLLVCPFGAKAAAVFTTNKIVAAPVIVSKRNIKAGDIYGVVVNSGCANACTGKRGIFDAEKMCALTAEQIETKAKNILVASTGIIGHAQPMDKISAGIEKCAERLSATEQAGTDFANAILTTDTKIKSAVRIVKIGSKVVTIAGTTKGAGMIAPNMATTLCFVTTDCVISRPLLKKAFAEAIGCSLNRLTVDIHQSTNDTAIILASGLAGNKTITVQNANYRKFAASLKETAEDLARQMALDAEGATRMFKVIIKGAATQKEAAKAARAVADSPLVKCAINGGDPNWGRIICAVGSVGVKLNPAKVSCRLDDLFVFKNGTPAKFDVKKASQIVSSKEYTITVELGAGKRSDFCYGCDLSRDYVTINADYHT